MSPDDPAPEPQAAHTTDAASFTWGRRYEDDDRFRGIVRSIDTGRTGNFRYSPEFYGPTVLARANVALVGNRDREYREAENATRPRVHGETWHHVFMVAGSPVNRCNMQLVSSATHRATCPHLGGFGQYVSDEADGAYEYEGVADLESSAELVRELAGLLAVDAAHLNVFQQRAGTELPDDLRALFLRLSGDEGAVRALLERPFKSGPRIGDIFPPDFSESGVFTILEEEREHPTGREFVADGAIPFAQTAGGDIFYRAPDGQVWFYDAEAMAPPSPVGATVTDLLAE